jgi:uncharacterized membrane protein YhdT
MRRITQMAEIEPIEESQAFKVAKKEAKITLIIWCIQSIIMLGIFFALGYNRTSDPLGYPLGLPGWYLIGGVIVGLIFLFVMIFAVKKYFTEVSLE